MLKLDKKDLQILSLLDWNCRIPITQIAKRIQLNKDVVRYRIKNLEEENIITGYYPLIDISKLGYLTFRGYLSFIDVDSETEQKIINYLDVQFNAGIIFTRDGEYDLGFISWEKSIYEFQKKLNDFKKLFGNYLNKSDFTIFTEFNHYSLNEFNENFSKEIAIKENEQVLLKEDDLEILKELSNNAKISSVDLSTKLKIPQTTIIHKIKELEKKKIILAYRAEINFSKLGYENYFLEIYTHNGKDIEKIESQMKLHKNCIYSVMGIFGSDIEIECEFKDKDDLQQFIKTLKNDFKSIRKINYCSTLKYFKMKYFPTSKKPKAQDVR